MIRLAKADNVFNKRLGIGVKPQVRSIVKSCDSLSQC